MVYIQPPQAPSTKNKDAPTTQQQKHQFEYMQALATKRIQQIEQMHQEAGKSTQKF